MQRPYSERLWASPRLSGRSALGPLQGPCSQPPGIPRRLPRSYGPLALPQGDPSGAVYHQQPREVRQSLVGGASLGRRPDLAWGSRWSRWRQPRASNSLPCSLALGRVCPGGALGMVRCLAGVAAYLSRAASLIPPVATSGRKSMELYCCVALVGLPSWGSLLHVTKVHTPT